MDDKFTALLEAAKASVDAMTPEQRAEMWRLQRESYVIAESGFGSDKDEAEHAAAIRSGDPEAIARCEAAAEKRVAAARSIIASGHL